MDFYATKANDVFALGIVFLEAATLQSLKNAYNWDLQKFDYAQLHQMESSLRQKYSANLVSIITDMTKVDHSQRVDCFKLAELAHQYWNSFMQNNS